MRDYRYDHVHLRSADPDAMGRFFETMFGAEVKRDIYPPGTLYPGQMRVSMNWAGRRCWWRQRIRTIRQPPRHSFRITA